MSYAAKIEKSSVKIVDTSTGSTKRTISGSFQAAAVQGDEAHCTQSNGRIRVVNIKTGSTIRTI